jgi:hypothetical protein
MALTADVFERPASKLLDDIEYLAAAPVNERLLSATEGFGVFEFHGWATIRVPEDDQADYKPIGRGSEIAVARVTRVSVSSTAYVYFGGADRRAQLPFFVGIVSP